MYKGFKLNIDKMFWSSDKVLRTYTPVIDVTRPRTSSYTCVVCEDDSNVSPRSVTRSKTQILFFLLF